MTDAMTDRAAEHDVRDRTTYVRIVFLYRLRRFGLVMMARWSTSGPVSIGMCNRLRAGKPSHHVISHSCQLSLAILLWVAKARESLVLVIFALISFTAPWLLGLFCNACQIVIHVASSETRFPVNMVNFTIFTKHINTAGIFRFARKLCRANTWLNILKAYTIYDGKINQRIFCM